MTGVLFAFTNTLSLKESRWQNVLKFPPRVAFMVLSKWTNGDKTTIFKEHEHLFEMWVDGLFKSHNEIHDAGKQLYLAVDSCCSLVLEA